MVISLALIHQLTCQAPEAASAAASGAAAAVASGAAAAASGAASAGQTAAAQAVGFDPMILLREVMLVFGQYCGCPPHVAIFDSLNPVFQGEQYFCVYNCLNNAAKSYLNPLFPDLIGAPQAAVPAAQRAKREQDFKF